MQSALVIPEAFKQKHVFCKITVFFAVDAEGKVIDATVSSQNKELRADLEHQFMKLNLKGLKPGVYNSIDVSFVVT